MAKESKSPKVERANRHPRRGKHDGDKVVSRDKRRGRGIQVIGEGNDLLSQIRQDKQATRPTSTTTTPAPKPTASTPQVLTDEQRTELAETAYREAYQLLTQDGTFDVETIKIPRHRLRWMFGLTETYVEPDESEPLVRTAFAMTCFKHGTPKGIFRGQTQSWYKPLFRELLDQKRTAQSVQRLKRQHRMPTPKQLVDAS